MWTMLEVSFVLISLRSFEKFKKWLGLSRPKKLSNGGKSNNKHYSKKYYSSFAAITI